MSDHVSTSAAASRRVRRSTKPPVVTCPACGKDVVPEHAVRHRGATYHARCALYRPTVQER